MLTPNPTEHTNDRLGFMLTMALAFHAALILGIGFAPLDLDFDSGVSRLEITLAQHKSEREPEKADYLAQHNQLGSGTEKEKSQLTTVQQSAFNDTLSHDALIQQQQQQQTAANSAQTPRVTTQQSQFKIHNSKDLPTPDSSDKDQLSQQQRQDIEIASLQAKLDRQRQLLAKAPRIQRLTSVASRATPGGRYLFDWQQRIEQIGNYNYPAAARQKKIYGDLQLLVVINADGSLQKATILRSSGERILDQAAKRIVYLSAPFPPFPADLRETTDIIEIIRTWRFYDDRISTEG